MNKKNKFNKKAQEEMVGFVLIVVIIVVIGVIVLGISLKKGGGSSIESKEIDSFLSSVSDFTTECEIQAKYQSIEKLVNQCDKKEVCTDGKSACDVLEQTLNEIMEHSTFVVAEGSGIYYYNLRVYESFEGAEKDLIEPISKTANNEIIVGACNGWEIYNDRLFYGQDLKNIYLGLRVCRSN